MKEIFSKLVQGLNSRATDPPARQETLASAKEESGIKSGAELASPPEAGSAPAATEGPPTRKRFAFAEAAKNSQDASPRISDAGENASPLMSETGGRIKTRLTRRA
jgi:hypothetical protein